MILIIESLFQNSVCRIGNNTNLQLDEELFGVAQHMQ